MSSEIIETPLTVGYFRPRIVLPADWATWSEIKMRGVLAHEIAHVERAHYLLQLFAFLNQCIFWFHPLAWFLRRRLALLSEKLCDESAIRIGKDKHAYAQLLLEIAASNSEIKRKESLAGLAMADQSQLKERIEAICQLDLQSTNRLSRILILFISLLASICWTAAASLCFSA